MKYRLMDLDKYNFSTLAKFKALLLQQLLNFPKMQDFTWEEQAEDASIYIILQTGITRMCCRLLPHNQMAHYCKIFQVCSVEYWEMTLTQSFTLEFYNFLFLSFLYFPQTSHSSSVKEKNMCVYMFNCINTHTYTYILRPFNYCFPIPTELEKKALHTKNPTFKVLISVCVYQSQSDCLFILTSKNGELLIYIFCNTQGKLKYQQLHVLFLNLLKNVCCLKMHFQYSLGATLQDFSIRFLGRNHLNAFINNKRISFQKSLKYNHFIYFQRLY